MNDFKLDVRTCKFLNSPGKYAKNSNLIVEPLTRQFKTAKEILKRFKKGNGVLLADDVGLGKTTVGALVAWIVALQKDSEKKFCNSVRIYAPNAVMCRRWAEELERHVSMLSQLGASHDRIKQGKVDRLDSGRIQITTHATLVDLNKPKIERKHKGNVSVECDLMIIDEAHRAKGESSAFNAAMGNFRKSAKRQLILTATPFSIGISELERLLQFVGADKDKLSEVTNYANELKRLYSIGDGHDVNTGATRLVGAAKKAIDQLQPYIIRHGIDDLSEPERKHFGIVDEKPWDIPTAPATQEDIALLLRTDRILQLAPERKGERRNDPRFHIGWRHLGDVLKNEYKRVGNEGSVVSQHIKQALESLKTRSKPHPKIAAVRDAISTVIHGGEKVLIFCHHRSTAYELLDELQRTLKQTNSSLHNLRPEVWCDVWNDVLADLPETIAEVTVRNSKVLPRLDKDKLVKQNKILMDAIIEWLCSEGIRSQVSGWLGEPASDSKKLKRLLEKKRPRYANNKPVPTIADSAKALVKTLLDEQSKSTRAVLRNIHNQKGSARTSHFPGDLDNGYRVMGFWERENEAVQLETLYTGRKEPDMVLAIFNSPFGPDVLVTTDRLSEGVDLHRCCRHLIHYELDPSPVRTLQRNGRVRRVGSWAALTDKPIQYAYPSFGGTRDEKAVAIMRQRVNAFGVLLGGVPSLDADASDSEQSFAEAVLCVARKDIESYNRCLCVSDGSPD